MVYGAQCSGRAAPDWAYLTAVVRPTTPAPMTAILDAGSGAVLGLPGTAGEVPGAKLRLMLSSSTGPQSAVVSL